jgi:hypothetical protein
MYYIEENKIKKRGGVDGTIRHAAQHLPTSDNYNILPTYQSNQTIQPEK